MRRRVSILLGLGVCAAFAVAGATLDPVLADPPVFASTTEAMRAGDGYYAAMARAMEERIGPAESVRAYRLPTPFIVWAALPTTGAIWLALTVWVGVGVVAAGMASRVPEVAPVIALVLLAAARPAFTSPEFWVATPALVAILAWRRGWTGAASAAATLAAAIRELALGLLLGVSAAALLWRRRTSGAAAGLIAIAILFVAHARLAAPYLVSPGSEAHLLSGGGLGPVFFTMGVGLPWPTILGPVAFVLAARRLAEDREMLVLAGPLVAVPLLGVAISRPYWGFLSVPLTLFFAAEGTEAMLRGGARDPSGSAQVR